jgi:deoxycytidine triphosphate deaminase
VTALANRESWTPERGATAEPAHLADVLEFVLPTSNRRGTPMSRMVTGDELLQAVKDGTFIQGGIEKSAEGIKYDFRLSQHVLKAKFKRPVEMNKLSQSEARERVVEPGEVVFVLTEERLKLPMNMLAQLSPKRKLSHEGIITLGGLSIDPGYEGRLLVGIFNLSSTPWPLLPGYKLIGATFYCLEGSELGEFPQPAEPFDTFPEMLIGVMEKYHPVAAQALADKVKTLEAELVAVRSEVAKHHRFEEVLERHDKQIDKILTGLEAEKVAREKGEDKLSQSMEDIQKTFHRIMGGAVVLAGIFTLILLPLIIDAVKSLFE